VKRPAPEAETPNSPPARSVLQQLSGLAERIFHARHRIAAATRHRFFVWSTVALFLAVFVVGLVNLPPIHRPVRWPLFALSGLVGQPLMLLLLAAEYDASARLVGRYDVLLRDALRVSVLSTAANLLPIPGSPIVRTASLKKLGTPVHRAVLSTATVGVSWLGTGALLVGALIIDSSKAFGVALLGIGIALLAITYALVARMSSGGVNALFVRILLIEAAFVTVASTRFWLVLEGLRESPSISQAAALTLSGMVASMTGIFPGGLGIRELAAGAISPLVHLQASVGVVSAAIIRLADVLVLAPFTFVLLRRTGRPEVEPDRSTSDELRPAGP
jgi:hypothetical protein